MLEIDPIDTFLYIPLNDNCPIHKHPIPRNCPICDKPIKGIYRRAIPMDESGKILGICVCFCSRECFNKAHTHKKDKNDT